jgi:hypothetical protein
MPFLIALVIAMLGWAIWKGKLKIDHFLPVIMGLAGGFLVMRGNLVFGLGAIAVAVAWYRGLNGRLLGSKNKQNDQIVTDKARLLLGVSRFDNAARIRERHRALITQNHPDIGGSEDRARELNEARDHLLRELEKYTR